MKVRKEFAMARDDLRRDISERMEDGHECDSHRFEGMTCIICALHQLRKPFALLQYLRSKGGLREVLPSEAKLIELIGEEEVKKRMEAEVEIIRNIPKKPCFNCGKIVAIWMPYTIAAIYVSDGKRLKVTCRSCGCTVFFDRDEIRLKNRKLPKTVQQRIVANSLARRMQHTEHSKGEYYEDDVDDEHYDDDQDGEDEE